MTIASSRTADQLLAAIDAGGSARFLFFRGHGMAADDPDALHPARWRGLNLLGFALMDAREALAAED